MVENIFFVTDVVFVVLCILLCLTIFCIVLAVWEFHIAIAAILAIGLSGAAYESGWLGLLTVAVGFAILHYFRAIIFLGAIIIGIVAFAVSVVKEEHAAKKSQPNETEAAYAQLADLHRELQNHFSTYVRSMTESINTGNFAIAAPHIDAESKLYSTQTQLVKDLKNRNIQERFYEATVDSYEQLAPDRYLLHTYERIGIIKNGTEEVKEFHYSYTITRKDKLYMSSIIE